ncbi:MAG: pyridoxamine 5'-phosphate oxidase family protein [Anaerolineae bacterium]
MPSSRRMKEMSTNPQNQARIKLTALLNSQRYAVLATVGTDGVPHTSLMAFAPTPDLTRLIFATRRDTRKYASIRSNPTVALLIDNRDNVPEDVERAIAVTATGEAQELRGKARARGSDLYLARHPYMADLVTSPDCALIQVNVTVYQIVSQLDEIVYWRPTAESDGHPKETIG